MNHRRRLAAVLALMSISVIAEAECRGTFFNDTVCTEWWDGQTTCTTTYRYYEYCTYGGGGGGTSGGGGTQSGSPADTNANGRIDEWRGVVNTDDPCANNFAENDRLGTDFGGSNSIRTGHSGVDIQANRGDAIYPYMDGTVSAVGLSGDCGFRVSVKNINGTYGIYCHMVENSSPVAVGARVYAGYTRIGSVDSTGSSSGDHLHIGVRDGSNNILGPYYNSADTQPSSAMLQNGGC
jgi:murein DD-endopeptidase MepM/ murein hydrolase activator NlpD